MWFVTNHKGGVTHMTDRQSSSQQAHSRAVRREIVLPFVGGLVLIVVLCVIAVIAGATSTSAISSTLLTVIILCPLSLVFFVVYVVLVLAVVGMNRAHGAVGKPLRRLEDLTVDMKARTYSISDRLARGSINVNARFAPLDRLIFSYFDRPKKEDDDE
jgi:hypothetical protein